MDSEGTMEDPELLMEVLEVQEQLEAGAPAEQLRAIEQRLDAQLRDSYAAIGRALESGDLQEAKHLVTANQYWHGLHHQVRSMLL